MYPFKKLCHRFHTGNTILFWRWNKHLKSLKRTGGSLKWCEMMWNVIGSLRLLSTQVEICLRRHNCYGRTIWCTGQLSVARTLTMRLLCKLKQLTRHWRKFYEHLESTWFMLLQIALATSCYCVVWAPRGWRGNERKTWLKSDAQMVWCNLPCVEIINGKWTQRCFAVNAAHLLRRLNHGSSGKDCRSQNCKASTKSIRHRRCHKILISWSATHLAGSKTA